MELPLRTIIILILVALILVVLTFFITTTSTPEITTTDANRVFSSLCQQYSIERCPWSVTRQSEFSDYLAACRYLYGDYRDKFSCLYSLCEQCKEFEPTDKEVECAAVCESCTANERLGISTVNCCSNFASSCQNTDVSCRVCRV